MTLNYGLAIRDIKTIENIFHKYPEVEIVYIFGSRAKGNFHTGSDIDLAIMNKDINNATIRNLLADFEDSTLPYFVDIVHYPGTNESLREHIDRAGQLFYTKNHVPAIVHEKSANYKKPDHSEDEKK